MNLHYFSVLALLVTAQTAPVETAAPPRVPPAEVKAAFLKQLDRPRVPLDVLAESVQTEDGLSTERLSFAAEKKADGTIERVPVLLVRPESAAAGRALPAVIVLHGTGGSKDKMRSWLVD